MPDLRTDLDRPEPIHRQIGRQFEEAIAAGAYRPGDKVPSTTELAARFGVTTKTIQKSLDRLHRRGLLCRTRGRGTFISASLGAGTLGVAFGCNVFHDEDHAFSSRLFGHLLPAARALGWDLQCFVPADDQDLRPMLLALDQAVAAGRLRGVLTVVASPPLQAWAAEVRDTVTCPLILPVDPVAVPRLGAAHLLARGFDRPCLLPPAPPGSPMGDAWLAGVAQAFAAAGRPLPADLVAGHANRERAGQLAAEAVLARERPRAWLVGDDNACRGVVATLLRHGQRIPEDALVATHANRGRDPFPGVPLVRLEIDTAAVARAALERLLARIAGTPDPTALVEPELVEG